MMPNVHTSPVIDTSKPMSAHGSSSPEVMRPGLGGIKSRASQLQFQPPQEMNPNSYSPVTNPSSGTYSGAGSSNGADNFAQPGSFKRSHSDNMNRGHDSHDPALGRPQRQSFGMSDAKTPEFSRTPFQTNIGPYGLLSSASGNSHYHVNHTNTQPPFVNQQNFTPFTLPPPGFSTSVTAAAPTREADPTYPTSMPSDYSSEANHHQQSGPDMMLLDQMAVPNTMPVFGGEGYNRSPFAIPEDFVAYLFSGQQLDSASPMGAMGQQGYAKSAVLFQTFTYFTNLLCSYPDAQNQYYTPYFSDVNLGGFFPPTHQQPHVMAVTSLLDTSLPETVLSEEKSQAIVDLIKDRFNEGDHAPVARQKEALLEGDRSDDTHMLSRKMMQTYIGSYWYHFSEQVPIRKYSNLLTFFLKKKQY